MSKKALITIVVIFILVVIVVIALVVTLNKAKIAGSSTSAAPTSFMVQDMKVDVTRQGKGDETTKSGDFLVVNYINTLEDGTKIDSTYDEGRRPLTFKLGAGQVLKGWDAGLVGMKVGEVRKLTIPPDLAFGQDGFPTAGIPKNATIISQVELLAIQH